MATLHEYFVKDGAQNLTTQQVWNFEKEGIKQGDLTARLHLDFDANAKYISFFIPEMPNVVCPEAIALNTVAEILAWPETLVGVQAGMGEEVREAKELVFTGQVYLYSERAVPEHFKNQLTSESNELGQKLTFRSTEYANEREKWERPLAFISHDTRDKADIAEPIALRLQKLMCPVWYDQFSLHVGDSLRESIEQGLKECKKCILILTPNFLSNTGWSKQEYDSIFTRELIEKEKVILPIWHNVSAQDVYQYSPILADRVALNWSLGVDQVAAKLFQAFEA